MTLPNSLLSSVKPAEPVQDRAHNPINGGDAETYAMAKLVLACRGEGRWSSRAEDGSKIDLIFSCEHPWHKGERLLVLSQVKSGPSYGEITQKGFKLTGAAKAAARRTSHGICTVWINRDNGKAFWAYVHPDSSIAPQEYGAQHELCPATLYDLARCMSVARPGVKGAGGIIVRRRNTALSQRRKRVKSIYRELGKARSPVLGEVEFTRTAWRHMFRSSRRKANKAASLDLVPHLQRLISRWPSSHAVISTNFFDKDNFCYRICEHLLKFDELSVSSETDALQTGFVACIRVIEEIRYPKDWASHVMRSQLVERRVALKSAYFKPKVK